MSTVKVSITHNHIDYGRPRRCSACPIALAVNELTKDDVSPKVYAHAISFGGFFACLPTEAMEFINSFDRAEDVYPIDFRIDITGHEESFWPEYITP